MIPSSDSADVFVTYTGTGGKLPLYLPAASGPGTLSSVALATYGSAAPVAPVAGACLSSGQHHLLRGDYGRQPGAHSDQGDDWRVYGCDQTDYSEPAECDRSDQDRCSEFAGAETAEDYLGFYGLNLERPSLSRGPFYCCLIDHHADCENRQRQRQMRGSLRYGGKSAASGRDDGFGGGEEVAVAGSGEAFFQEVAGYGVEDSVQEVDGFGGGVAASYF